MSSFIRRKVVDEDFETDWIVPFCDVLALLLAFFVIILSTSSPHIGKLERLLESWATMTSGEAPETPFTDIKDGFDDLVIKHNLQGSVDITMDHDGVLLEFSDLSLFQPGKANLNNSARDILSKAVIVINEHSRAHYEIEVEGHTDDVPIHNDEFVSNWELSSARSTGVVRHLISKGISPLKLKGSSFADTRPKIDIKSTEDLKQARAANRRILIYVHR